MLILCVPLFILCAGAGMLGHPELAIIAGMLMIGVAAMPD